MFQSPDRTFIRAQPLGVPLGTGAGQLVQRHPARQRYRHAIPSRAAACDKFEEQRSATMRSVAFSISASDEVTAS